MNFQKVIITTASAVALIFSACGDSPKVTVEATDAAELNGAPQDSIVSPMQAQPKEIIGTIVSEMEHFAFTPVGNEASYWINDDSYNAQGWSIIENLHRSLKEKQSDPWNSNLPIQAIYMCVTGSASVKGHTNGIGHRGLWTSDITLTKVFSAKSGKCPSQTHLKLSFEDSTNINVQKNAKAPIRQDLVPASLDSDHRGLIGLNWVIQELNGDNLLPTSAEEWLAEPTYPYFTLYRQQDGDIIVEGYTGCNMFRGPVYQEKGNSERLHTPKLTLISERECFSSDREKEQDAILGILTTENIWQSVKIKYQHRLSLGQEPDVKLKATMLLGQQLKGRDARPKKSVIPDLTIIPDLSRTTRRINRDVKDRVYSAQICSQDGLDNFFMRYGFPEMKWTVPLASLGEHYYIAAFSDNLSETVHQIQKNEATKAILVDFVDTGIRYKLTPPEKGTKYSDVTLLAVSGVCETANIGVRKLSENELSQRFE